jgi:hypothetical protein
VEATTEANARPGVGTPASDVETYAGLYQQRPRIRRRIARPDGPNRAETEQPRKPSEDHVSLATRRQVNRIRCTASVNCFHFGRAGARKRPRTNFIRLGLQNQAKSPTAAASRPTIVEFSAPITQVIDRYGLYYEALAGVGSINKLNFF